MNQLERNWHEAETKLMADVEEVSPGQIGIIKQTFHLGAVAMLLIVKDNLLAGHTPEIFASRMQEIHEYCVDILENRDGSKI